MMKSIEYILSDEQVEKLEAWKRSLPEEPPTAIGGRYTFMLTPTGLGIIIRVRACDTNDEIDLTDYDSF